MNAKHLIGCTRAIANQAKLNKQGNQWFMGYQKLAVASPHLQTASDSKGACDAVGVRLALSNADLHAANAPEEPIQRFIFELLEQLRVESIIPEHWQGIKHNVMAQFDRWSHEEAKLLESHFGLLIFTLVQMVRAAFNSTFVDEFKAEAIEQTRAALSPLLGKPLYQMRKTKTDQYAYAPHALTVAALLYEMVAQESENIQTKENLAMLTFVSEMLDQTAFGGTETLSDSEKTHYYVYTTDFDQQKTIQSLVRTSQLQYFRIELDEQLTRQKLSIRSLATQMAQAFQTPNLHGWQEDQVAGVIDPQKLLQVVMTPDDQRIFLEPSNQSAAKGSLSLLLDCSGSMKVHVNALALLVDRLIQLADIVGVQTEVLGFSTTDWNGGQARKNWQAAGQPDNPGRLNGQMHVVFKSFQHTRKQARKAVAGLMKQTIYKEGIGGEAVEWASERLLKQPSNNRLLLLIGDGCPMDTATMLTNGTEYIENHLQKVIMQYQKSPLAIAGIGIDNELNVALDHQINIELDRALDNPTLDRIIRLMQTALSAALSR